MSIKVNGKEIKQIKIAGKEISLGKVNGHVVWSGEQDCTLEYIAPYNLTYTAKESGTYQLRYADRNGILMNYDYIASMKGVRGTYAGLTELNVAPSSATRIVLTKNNIIKAEIPVPAFLRNTYEETMQYKVGLISDTHIDGDGDDTAASISDLTSTLTFFNNQNVDFVAHCGDFSQDNREVDYTAITNILSNFPNTILYSIAGNHDNYSTLETITGNPLYYEQVMPNDDVFLFCGAYRNYPSDPFSNEELAWLQSKLEEYGSNRVFLFIHYYTDPVGDANYLDNDSIPNSSQGATIRNLLSLHNTHVAYFSGHSHLTYRLQDVASTANVSLATQDLPIRVHIPSDGRPRILVDGSITNDYVGSECAVMEVYSHYIKIQGYDLSKGKYIPLAMYAIPFEVYEAV